MYKTIEQIRKLKDEKKVIMRSVYQSNDPDEVYEKQTALRHMSMGISSDVTSVIIPALQEDGVSSTVSLKISLRLNESLSFIGIPTASEIREKYKQSVENPTVVKIHGAKPDPRTKTNVKKISVPAFLSLLISQGIAVPLLVSFLGGSKWALVKIVPCAINAALMVVEVVKYFNLVPKKRKRTIFAPPKKDLNPSVDYEDMCKRAVQEVYRDNLKRLDNWFDILEKIATEEIEKALEEAEG